MIATKVTPRYSVWRRILMFLSVVGPGIITANADNDVGGIMTYSHAARSSATRCCGCSFPSRSRSS